MATVAVRNKANELVAEVTARSFGAFKRQQPGKVALLLPIGDDGEVILDTCKRVKLLPGGRYEARLLSRVRILSEVANELRGCDVWKEA